MDMSVAVPSSGSANTSAVLPFNERRSLILASREVTQRGFYARLKLLLTGQIEGNLDIDLYNSRAAADAWIKFAAKKGVTGPEEGEVLPELLKRNAALFSGSTALLEGGPGTAYGKIIQLLVATEALQYVGYESSRPIRAQILGQLKRHLIAQGHKDIADRLSINLMAHDFNQPHTATNSPGATYAVLGASISNIPSQPGGKVPYDELVEVIGNYAKAVGLEGTTLITTDAHDHPAEVTGKDFAKAYYDPDFIPAYYDLVDRMVKDFGVEFIDPKTGEKLDPRIMKPAFDWEGEEIHYGSGGHKVAHKIMALNNTKDLTGPDDTRLTRDVIVRVPAFDDFSAYEIFLPAGKGIVALNSIKWPSHVMRDAHEDAGVTVADTVQSLQNRRSTAFAGVVGEGGRSYRQHARDFTP